MKVLIACEFSGVVREAFWRLGHDAWSCDLLPTERPGNHIEADAIEVIRYGHWDLLIAHHPCTHLAVSGARWFGSKRLQQWEALQFFAAMLTAPVQRICIENPVSVVSSRIRRPDQVIQPWQFGHGEVKSTCLWLRNLPRLKPTKIVEGRAARVHRMPPSADRWKERSRTLDGVAMAMAEQWSE